MRQGRRLKQLNKILYKVKCCREEIKGYSDEALSHLTEVFKDRLAAGESLESLLPEAFAAICEADYRILGMMPFDVQILGGIALHQGYLAEMNTGEGKTLVATMPLYLNALTGNSTVLVTANEYLALRDAEDMGKVYRFMGLSVAAGVRVGERERFTNEEKKSIYAADIVYTTHGVLGFDYLLNNLVTSAGERFLRDFHYVIIDEADSVLLDAAQMPLVISGSPRVQSNLYELADFFVTTLTEDIDYVQEDNKVWLTHEGIRNAERFFQIDNFYGRQYFEINRHVTLALRAHVLFQIGKEYMISSEGELILLDKSSGRMMPGVKLRGGQHQAIEVKEKLQPSQESRAVAAITYQNLFRMFPRMSGMSGTLADASEEIRDVYGKEVLVIPPNRPIRRRDMPDTYFCNAKKQFQMAVLTALEAHRLGQPVLIVVTTIAETEQVSKVLIEKGIPHNVLNANNAFWEAEIIREAGQKNAVTVATSMAGRGTDIKLGEGVEELGGLQVIGIGRMINTRQERQARGRAGRQGNVGSSHFFVSLEDEIVVNSGISHLDDYIEGRKRISKYRLKMLINRAQAVGEEFAALSRKRAMDYDLVMQWQRELIYATRDGLLDGGMIEQETIVKIAKGNIGLFLNSKKGNIDQNDLNRYILDNISCCLDEGSVDISLNDCGAMEGYLIEKVKRSLEEQTERFGDHEYLNDFVRMAILNSIDNEWIEQVDYLQQLQAAVSGRAFAQRNLVFEYQEEAFKSFMEMKQKILRNAIRNILLGDVYVDTGYKLHILFP